MSLRGVPAAGFEVVPQPVGAAVSRLFTLPHAANTDDWYTPAWIFEAMDVTFDLDVAAPPGGVPWIPARRSFSLEDDGLAQEWEGFVWCNPPYSHVRPWATKWANHGDGLLVVSADLSSSGQFSAFTRATTLFVPEGRLKFANGHGDPKHSPNFTAVILGAGLRASRALNRLDNYGSTRDLV